MRFSPKFITRSRRVAPITVGILALAILLAVGCGSQDLTPKQSGKQGAHQRRAKHATEATRQTGTQQNTGHSTGDPVVVAAGDIASCESNGDEATAHLLVRIGGTVLTLGDNAYEEKGISRLPLLPPPGRSIRPHLGSSPD